MFKIFMTVVDISVFRLTTRMIAHDSWWGGGGEGVGGGAVSSKTIIDYRAPFDRGLSVEMSKQKRTEKLKQIVLIFSVRKKKREKNCKYKYHSLDFAREFQRVLRPRYFCPAPSSHP